MKLEGCSQASPNRSAVESSCTDVCGSLPHEIHAHCDIVRTVVPQHRGIGSIRALIAGAGFDPKGAPPSQFVAEDSIGRVIEVDMVDQQWNAAFQCERAESPGLAQIH